MSKVVFSNGTIVTSAFLNAIPVENLDDVTTGKFDISLPLSFSCGFDADHVMTAHFIRVGAPTGHSDYPAIVSLTFAKFLATSNATVFTSFYAVGPIVDNHLLPNNEVIAPCALYDNATLVAGQCRLKANGVMEFMVGLNASGFTASGNKGVPNMTITYPVWP